VVFLGGYDLRRSVKFICVGGEQDGVDKGTPYGNLWKQVNGRTVWKEKHSLVGTETMVRG